MHLNLLLILCIAMSHWFRILLIAAILGFAKAHHFVRLVILAGLGLAGLWMVHTLAQDYTNIQSSSSGGEAKLFKRSTPEGRNIQIHWDLVLSRDPASCARSFLCQLAATEDKLLTGEEQKMLDLSRTAAQQDTWASKQLQEALRNGERVDQPSQCMKIYKYCPYTSQMMMTLLRVFGR